MHIHVDKMRGNNAWETVKMRKKKQVYALSSRLSRNHFCMKIFI